MGKVVYFEKYKQRILDQLEELEEKEFELELLDGISYLPKKNQLSLIVTCLKEIVTFNELKEYLEKGKILSFKGGEK